MEYASDSDSQTIIDFHSVSNKKGKKDRKNKNIKENQFLDT